MSLPVEPGCTNQQASSVVVGGGGCGVRRSAKRLKRKHDDPETRTVCHHFDRSETVRRFELWDRINVRTSTKINLEAGNPRHTPFSRVAETHLTSEFNVNTSSALHGVMAGTLAKIRDILEDDGSQLPEIHVRISNSEECTLNNVEVPVPDKSTFQWYRRIPVKVMAPTDRSRTAKS